MYHGSSNLLHLRIFDINYHETPHVWMEIPEVGHDAEEIFTHSDFLNRLRTLGF